MAALLSMTAGLLPAEAALPLELAASLLAASNLPLPLLLLPAQIEVPAAQRLLVAAMLMMAGAVAGWAWWLGAAVAVLAFVLPAVGQLCWVDGSEGCERWLCWCWFWCCWCWCC